MRYDLVFEGGGAKGMALVGACEALLGAEHEYGRLLGTSAGAIAAVFIAAGYTPKEMKEALQETDTEGRPVFEAFMGMPRPFVDEELNAGALASLLERIDFKLLPAWVEKRVGRRLIGELASMQRTRNFVALVERGGWYGADQFVSWFAAKLDSGEAKGGGRRAYSGMTLGAFHQATGVDVSVVAADTRDGTMLVLNHRTAPECPVVWAVRMSMSIPLLWEEVVWRREWGSYRGREITGHSVVDGGTLSNFPIELFLSRDRKVIEVMGESGGDPVLGFLMDESLAVPVGARGLFVDVDVNVRELATVKRLMGLVDTMMGAHDRRVMDAHPECIVRLPAKGYGTTEFAMTPARRDALVDAAAEATRQHIGGVRARSFAAADATAAPVARGLDAIALEILGE